MFYKRDELGWLNSLAHSWGLAEAFAKQQGVFAWRHAVGQQLARWARPLYVSRGVLHLAVSSYAAASQLRMLEPKLMEALREVAPQCEVRQLRLHVQPQAAPRRGASEAQVSGEDLCAADGLVPDDVPVPLRQQLVQTAARARAQERAILEAGGRRCDACQVAFLGDGTVCPLCSLVGGGGGGLD
ncbi:MAG: DUF721 domain-containing protein [Candidatus Bipolaricaulota bacterium]